MESYPVDWFTISVLLLLCFSFTCAFIVIGQTMVEEWRAWKVRRRVGKMQDTVRRRHGVTY